MALDFAAYGYFTHDPAIRIKQLLEELQILPHQLCAHSHMPKIRAVLWRLAGQETLSRPVAPGDGREAVERRSTPQHRPDTPFPRL
jgi:hypothetical protein